MRFRARLVAVVGLSSVLVGLAPVGRAEEPRLGSYIPADVHFFGDWVGNDAVRRIQKPVLDAMRRLRDSGIVKDVFDLATMELGENERDEARKVVRRVLELMGTPSWKKLCRHEVALAFRIQMPFPEYLVLFRVPSEEIQARHDEFRKTLEGVASFAPDTLTVSDSENGPLKVLTLTAPGMPVALSVAAGKGMVAMCTSPRLLDECASLAGSEDASNSVLQRGNVRELVRDLPDDAVGISRFDLAGYFGFFKGLLEFAGGASQGDERAEAGLSIIGTVLDELMRMDAISAVERASGNRYTQALRISFSQGESGPGFIENLIAGQKPIEEFHRVVPRDAVSFSMTSGFDPQKVYEGIMGLIRERFPDSERLMRRWNRLQERMGVHLEGDLLSWIDGGCGSICLPSRSGGGGEWIAFLRTKDHARAVEVMRGIFKKVQGYVESRGQILEANRLTDLEGFFRLRVASMPWLQPVVGMPEGVIVLASSEDAVRRVAETYSGQAPSILENPRFAALGVPRGPVHQVYYVQVKGMLELVSDVVGTVGFVASILPRENDTRPVIKLGAILTKLAACIRDCDIARDYGGWMRYDAESHSLRGRRITTFDLPPRRQEL